MNSLENYFSKFRQNIVGIDQELALPYGAKKMIYADWTASGRLYQPIENYLSKEIGPFVANTHSKSTFTGQLMTQLYEEAKGIIKTHVNASANEVLLTCGSGMTAAINKFQRLLNLRIPEKLSQHLHPYLNEKPLVIITHMEHHSNQTSWYECFCDVQIIQADAEGLPDLNHLRSILMQNKQRKLKIGSFTAASNVTGVYTPIHQMAQIMHEYGGLCFADYAASAPYVSINMNPAERSQKLDAVFFSPHKFLGGPGSCGILVFDRELYQNKTPDHPGGGTVAWTTPWGQHRFVDDVEEREDGGTPAFLQTMRAALAIQLKMRMGLEQIQARDTELTDFLLKELSALAEINILEPHLKRQGIISFYSPDIHYNLIVRLLNDRFGIQSRGGCSCAGTYGHILFKVAPEQSKQITCKIDQGDLSEKPGWVRISVHPTMSNNETENIVEAIQEVCKHHKKWREDYVFERKSAEFMHKEFEYRNLSALKNALLS